MKGRLGGVGKDCLIIKRVIFSKRLKINKMHH